MDVVPTCWLVLLFFICIHRPNVNGELLPRLVNYELKLNSDGEITQDTPRVRAKRNTPRDGQAVGARCGCKITPDTGRGPNIVVHHYHHYYFCCPNMAEQLRRNPHLAQAVGLNLPPPGQNVSSVAGSINCECSVTGYCVCGVNCQCHHEQPKPTPTPHGDKSKAFGFGLMYNDPIGKQFFDFMSKNFMRKENTEQGNACSNQKPSIGFDDPVCKEFFEFFSKNVVQKSEAPTAAPTQPPTPPHTQPSNQGPKVFFQEIKNMDDMKNVFEAINNQVKDTISKTGLNIP